MLTESEQVRSHIAFNPQYTCKTIVLGDVNVGKSCLLHRMYKNEFRKKKPTVETDRVKFDAILDDGTRIRLNLWDTVGGEAGSMSSLFYRGSFAAIICFNLTDRKTFERIAKWNKDLG